MKLRLLMITLCLCCLLPSVVSAADRFTNNLNGTLTDNTTGLVWMRNDCSFSSRNYSIEFAKTIASGVCWLNDGSHAGDWRLPTKEELDSVIRGPGAPLMACSGDFCSIPHADGASPYVWLRSQGFDIGDHWYWTSTAYTYSSQKPYDCKFEECGWTVNMLTGDLKGTWINWSLQIWPVRNGPGILSYISGTVSDVATGSPLAGAVVKINNQIYQADTAGKYMSTALVPGAYTVTASKSGYVTLTASRVTAANSTITQDFPLSPTALLGGPEDNPNTLYDRDSSCRTPGFPTYAVNTATLNLVVQDTEFSLGTLGPGLDTTRTWNANPSQVGMFGNGWSFPYELTLQKSCDGARLQSGSGTGAVYSATLCGTLSYPVVAAAPTEVFDKLTYQSGNYWLLYKKDSRQTYRYDPAPAVTDLYRLTSITDLNGNALLIMYNSDGMISKVRDAAGRELTFTYANKRVTVLGTPDGRQVTFGYDAKSNLIRTVDLYGTEILYAYDAENYLTAMSYAGKTIRYTYDTSKRLATLTDATGAIKSYAATSGSSTTIKDARGGITATTSSNGRTTSVTDPAGAKTATTYSTNGMPMAVTDPKGNQVAMEYDARGNLTKKTDALGKVSTFTYDANDNLLKSINPLGETWSFTYDGRNNLTSITSPLGKVTSFTYDAKGQLTAMTDGNGGKSVFTYDAFGNVKTSQDPLGNITTFGYDSAGINRTSSTDPLGRTRTFAYDQNRRLIRTTNPDGAYRDFSYDACSLTGATDENGNRTILTRNPNLQVTAITDALNAVTTNAYDGNGNLVSVTTPLTQTVAQTYDSANRLTKQTNPLGGTIQFALDANGTTTGMTNERLNLTGFTYDANDAVTATKDPLNRTVSLIRDSLGRVTQEQNARGGAIGFAYNTDGQMTAKSYGAQTQATYAYDNAGSLVSFTHPAGTTAYTRDAAGRVTRITYHDTTVLALTYDAAGNVKTLTYPGGLTASYTYDTRNRMASVTFNSKSVTLSYNAAGNLTGESRTNGVQSAYIYDKNRRLAGVSHKKGAKVIVDLTYARDVGGRITGETGIRPLAPKVTQTALAATYDAADGISTWKTDACSHDPDGNLTGITGSRTFSAVYDHENRPTAITLGGVTTNHLYNGVGNRVQSQTPSGKRVFHHDPWGRLLFETNAVGQVTACYIYADNRLMASGTVADGFVYHHHDKTGSTLALTDSAGAVVGAYAYSPYGMVVNRSGSVQTPFTHVGAFGVMDEGNGLYFMTNRYYDAVTGRFLQKDPVGFAGGQTNLYAYAGGNPVAGIDPQGLLPMDGGGGWERLNVTVQQMDLETRKTGAIVAAGVMLIPTAALILPELIAAATIPINPVTTSSVCTATVTAGSRFQMSASMKMAADELLAALLTPGVDILATAKNLGATPLGREIIKNTAIRAEQYLAATIETNTAGAVTSQLGGIVQVISQFMH